MAGFDVDACADLLNATQADEGEMKLTDLTSDLQYYIVAPQLMKRRRTYSGDLIKFNTLMKPSENFRDTGMFDTYNLNQEDGQVIGEIPWRMADVGWTADIRQFAINRSPRKIVDFLDEKKMQMITDTLNGFEERFWSKPTDSSDTKRPYGVKYWFVYNATEGFNGGNHGSWASGPAGISATTYPRWKHWTAQYTAVTKEDLVRKIRTALFKCGFRSLPGKPIPDYGQGGTQRYGMYTVYSVIRSMEELAEAQNMNLGNDLASKDGMVTIRRHSLEAVPYWDENDQAGAPVLGLDWSNFRFTFVPGWQARRDKVRPAATQPNVVRQQTDWIYNIECRNRRTNFLIATGDWA